jgi:hypothetical protein
MVVGFTLLEDGRNAEGGGTYVETGTDWGSCLALEDPEVLVGSFLSCGIDDESHTPDEPVVDETEPCREFGVAIGLDELVSILVSVVIGWSFETWFFFVSSA